MVVNGRCSRRGWRVLAMAGALGASTLLSACSQLVSQPDTTLSTQPGATLTEAYNVSGRLLIRQGERQNSAHFLWRHRPDQDAILLATPLGQGLAELHRDARGAWLRHADGRLVQAADWQTLAAELLGQELPLQELEHWLLGRPPAAAQGRSLDARGRLASMVLDDWQITYRRYRDDSASALPQLIELVRGDTLARLFMDDWQPVSPTSTLEEAVEANE